MSDLRNCVKYIFEIYCVVDCKIKWHEVTSEFCLGVLFLFVAEFKEDGFGKDPYYQLLVVENCHPSDSGNEFSLSLNMTLMILRNRCDIFLRKTKTS